MKWQAEKKLIARSIIFLWWVPTCAVDHNEMLFMVTCVCLASILRFSLTIHLVDDNLWLIVINDSVRTVLTKVDRNTAIDPSAADRLPKIASSLAANAKYKENLRESVCQPELIWARFSSQETCRLMISMFDRDHSGTINVQEFQQLYDYIEQWKRCFQSFDKDNSGNISPEELHQALSAFGYRWGAKIHRSFMTPTHWFPWWRNVQKCTALHIWLIHTTVSLNWLQIVASLLAAARAEVWSFRKAIDGVRLLHSGVRDAQMPHRLVPDERHAAERDDCHPLRRFSRHGFQQRHLLNEMSPTTRSKCAWQVFACNLFKV